LIAAEAAGDNQIADNIEVQSSVNFLPTAHIASNLGISYLLLETE
jgi:hypothetical protein